MPADTRTITLDPEHAKALLVELWALADLEFRRAGGEGWFEDRIGHVGNVISEAMFPDRDEWYSFSEGLFERSRRLGDEMWREFVDGPQELEADDA